MKLVPFEYVVNELATVGLTPELLSHLLASLRIPSLWLDNRRFFDFFAFLLALKARLRAGQPDLVLPSSTAADPVDAPTLALVIQELLAARELATLRPASHFKEAKRALQDAADRLSTVRPTAIPRNRSAKRAPFG